MSSVSHLTQAEALGDANKVTTSPPLGGGFGAQSRLSPRLRPLLTQITLSCHPLGEVTYELSLPSHLGRGFG